MGHASPFNPIALVIETDEIEREMVATLLEESEMWVIQCQSADVAVRAVDRMGPSLVMIFIDVNLKGTRDAVELSHFASGRRECRPDWIRSRSKHCPGCRHRSAC
jgi:two-component system, cell cycle response regulator CpdR